MGFQVEPERIGRRGARASVVIVIVAALGVVAFALTTSSGSQPNPSPVAQAAVSPTNAATEAEATEVASPSARPAPVPAPTLPLAGRPLKALDQVPIVCNAMSTEQCGRIVDAVASELVDPGAISNIQVWTSLRCRDPGDCPSSLTRGRVGLGSAAVAYGAGRSDRWLNVVARNEDPADFPYDGDLVWVAHESAGGTSEAH